MADGIDARSAGLAAKDIVVGIAAAVVGGYGGPAASEGVRDAGKGIDKLVDQFAPASDGKTRAQKFDSTDFATRPAVESKTPSEPRAATTQPALGDAKIAADYLAVLGWSPAEINRILAGPPRAAAPTGPAVQEAPGGTPMVDGKTIAAVLGKVLPQVAGKTTT